MSAEIHPYNAQPRAVQYAQEQGIAVTAYSSFGPLGFRELNTPKSLRTPPLFGHPTVTAVADAHGCTPAQAVLRWATQRGLAIIPKSDTEQQMRENLLSAEIVLAEEERAAITGLDVGLRFNDPADVSSVFHLTFLSISSWKHLTRYVSLLQDFEGCHIFS